MAVLTANNGAEAITMLTHLKADAAIVTTHISRADGFQICLAAREQAKSAGKNLPVWLITDAKTEEMSERATAAGAEGLLSEPIDLADLTRLIEERLAVPEKS